MDGVTIRDPIGRDQNSVFLKNVEKFGTCAECGKNSDAGDLYRIVTSVVAYLSGVGTGKSFVFLGLAEYMEGRIL